MTVQSLVLVGRWSNFQLQVLRDSGANKLAFGPAVYEGPYCLAPFSGAGAAFDRDQGGSQRTKAYPAFATRGSNQSLSVHLCAL